MFNVSADGSKLTTTGSEIANAIGEACSLKLGPVSYSGACSGQDWEFTICGNDIKITNGKVEYSALEGPDNSSYGSVVGNMTISGEINTSSATGRWSFNAIGGRGACFGSFSGGGTWTAAPR